MLEIIKKEQVPIWSFFCKKEGDTKMMNTISKEEAISNILDSNSSEFLILRVEDLVQKRLTNSITGSQLRKLFDVVQKGQLSESRVQLIYIAARQNNATAHELVQFVKELIKQIKNDENRLKNLKFFTASIVSYHNYYSKK